MSKPVVWFIGGFDPSCGAGISMDLKVASLLGVHGCALVTCLTAQNGREFLSLTEVSEKYFLDQWKSLATDFPPSLIKVGLLPPNLLGVLCEKLKGLEVPVCWDPVLTTTSGQVVWTESSREALFEAVIRFADLICINLPESRALLKTKSEEPVFLAKAWIEKGAERIFVKGGHGLDSDFSTDYYRSDEEDVIIQLARLPIPMSHGTGCSLAAAIASFRALGESWVDSTIAGKSFAFDALRSGFVSKGNVLSPTPGFWPEEKSILPSLVNANEACRLSDKFPEMNEPIGFYPIVPRVSLLREILSQGIKTAQLRIKDLVGQALEDEIEEAVRICKASDCRLFINDHWQLAIEYGAYGVHLGQEDLEVADLKSIQGAGLHLGISTHDYFELIKALRVQPSYVALGPVFPTKAKKMKFGPQGLEKLRAWVKLAKLPVVAIGGIVPERVPAIKNTGVSGFAVLTDLAEARSLKDRCREWKNS